MGNSFSVRNPPRNGSIVTIVESDYFQKQEIPPATSGVGSKAKVLYTTTLLKSRPNAPDITVSLVQLPNGMREVYPSGNLRG